MDFDFRTGSNLTSSPFSPSTMLLVSSSLRTPTFILSDLISTTSCSPVSMFMYKLMRSRYDFGVVYTRLRSCWKNSAEVSSIERCTKPHMRTTAVRTSSEGSSNSPRNLSATLTSAASGQPWNQSMVVQLMSEGNCLQRIRRLSPTGLMHRTMCSLSRTRLTKWAIQLSRVSGMPSSLHTLIISDAILSVSSWGNRLDTSPVLSTLLRSSSIVSSTICESVNKNTVSLPSTPVTSMNFLMSSRKSAMPYPRLISIDRQAMLPTKEAIRVRLCLPDPPTPMSIALPRGCRRMREMRAVCVSASSKNTRFICVGKVTL
mmetsp:Transcript_8241/g.18074  ORF Transcript_8241/g.18074 Transcript_8241/m.18074 type:complete len:316 (+) Transcript_8241:875-1822(+)